MGLKKLLCKLQDSNPYSEETERCAHVQNILAYCFEAIAMTLEAL
jgi:hypothetical protein